MERIGSRLIAPLQRKARRHRRQQQRPHLVAAEPGDPVEQPPHRPIADATGHDRGKARQIAAHIERQAVLADPAARADANGRNLAALQPHPGLPCAALARQIEGGEHIEHHLLKRAQVQMQISAMALQVEHRIEHQLARGMVGDLTAAVDAKQRVGRRRGVKAQKGRIGAAAEGVAGLMLQQQHRLRSVWIGEQALLPGALLRQGRRKWHQALWFKKDCVARGAIHGPFLALNQPDPRRPDALMKLLIHGRNLDVTPAIREYTETKLSRAINHFEGMVKEADVHLSVARNPRVPQQTAEVTMFANGTVIRAQERSDNLYASIDLVASKLTRQLNRFRERLHERTHGPVHRSARDEEAGAASLPPPGGSLTDGKEVATPSRGVRRKYFAMPPMDVDEALHQLEVIDHDFYVFKDKETGQIQVAYRRNHGGFGVIQAKE